MFKRWFISGIIIVALLIVLKNSIDWTEAYKSLLTFPKFSLMLFLTISLIISSVKSYRFFKLLRDSKIDIGFWIAFKTYFAGGATSPLPAGEVLRSALLKKEKDIKVRRSITPVLMQAYVEVFSAVLIVIVGSFFFELFLIPAILSLLLVVAIYLILSHDKPLRVLIKRSVKFKKMYDLLNKIKNNQINFKKTYLIKKKIIPNAIFLKAMLISFATHFLGGALLFFIIRSGGSNLNFVQSLYVYALGIVVSNIGSISPGGLGFTEGAMTAALLFFHVSLPAAVVAVLIFRVVTFVFNILLGLIFLSIFYRSLIKNMILKH